MTIVQVRQCDQCTHPIPDSMSSYELRVVLVRYDSLGSHGGREHGDTKKDLCSHECIYLAMKELIERVEKINYAEGINAPPRP